MGSSPFLYSIGELEKKGAILAIQDGNHGEKHPVSDDYVESGIPFIMARDISDGYLDLKGCKFIKKEQADSLRTGFAKPGDVLLTHKGTVGSVALVPPHVDDYVMLSPQVTYYRLNLKKINNRYFLYALREPGFQARLVSVSAQSTRPYVSITAQRDLKVLVYPLTIQHKIVSILSAYEDLIENNLRRIKILEEIAQVLYREWFVNFSFPGSEKVRLVGSELGQIPVGWKVCTLGEHLSALESGKRPKGGVVNSTKGIPSIGAENIKGIAEHDYTKEKYVPIDFFEGMKKGVVKDRDVAIYKDGAYIGRSTYFRDGFPHQKCCVNEHVFLVRTTGEQLTQNILYLWLQEDNTISQIRSTNANAAQPGINQSSVRSLKIIVSSSEIAKRFDSLVEPFFAEIMCLAKKNLFLHRTCDLLLPKLISGELDVSELDIKIPEELD